MPLKIEDHKLVIENNVPLPPSRNRTPSELRLLLAQMKPAQSILIPSGYLGREGKTLRAYVANSSSAVRKQNKELFFTSAIVEGGVRVWRIK